MDLEIKVLRSGYGKLDRRFHRSRATIHHLNEVLCKKNKMIRELNEKLRPKSKYDINKE